MDKINFYLTEIPLDKLVSIDLNNADRKTLRIFTLENPLSMYAEGSKESFKEYLMGRCLEDTHAPDDDLPDYFEDWIVDQDVYDVIKWAALWCEEQISKLSKVGE